MKVPKFCLFCNHLEMDYGDPGYSEYTPPTPPIVRCLKRHFYESYTTSSNATEKDLRILMTDNAKDCSDFDIVDDYKLQE